MTTVPTDGCVRATVFGHRVVGIVVANEPMSQRRRALADLAAALPTPEALHCEGASIRAIITTPDFHPGRPVPVGVVVDVQGAILPHVVGSDIGCGMRMIAIEGVTHDDLVGVMPVLKATLRRLYFQGGRDVALTGAARHGLLRHGLPGLLDAGKVTRGLLAEFETGMHWGDLERTGNLGGFDTVGIEPAFEEFARVDEDLRYDAILGSIGGGNHFVEFGHVDHVADGAFSRVARLRQGTVTLVVHSGSLDFGQQVAATARDALARTFAGRLDRRILPLHGELAPIASRYVMGMRNAANVGFGNRFLLGLCAIKAIRLATGKDVQGRLVYDSPHNLAWTGAGGSLHRKGACLPWECPRTGPMPAWASRWSSPDRWATPPA